ncbi:MAG TPA: Gfo/Idh/MocA family oxidoreductase [Candidatus Brocadiia bacterium]|nr:Gfo/Idh/MocA family oxidoreductase [Candidatus Brocadiia bacterium]
MSRHGVTRRTFVFGSALFLSGCASSRGRMTPKPISPNEKLNIAGIGCGGKGSSDVDGAAEGNNIVALCDVDDRQAGGTYERYPNARKYKDFRVMLEKEGANIDAVTISTPDHMHAPAAALAMKLGKHVYVQKPLTHSVWEARNLLKLAKETKVATQMGNQGTAGPHIRRLCEWIWSGCIGHVREAHIWTNRPIWPQDIARPTEIEQVPPELDWDLWQGVAPARSYNKAYLPFAWRGWWDYGCGALGDMGCHNMNPAYKALKLGYPTSVEAVSEGGNEESFPKWSIITYQFPAREDMPPCKVVWYDGGKMPDRPEGLLADETFGGGDNGTLFIGDKGKMCCGVNAEGFSLIPKALMKDYPHPARTIPDSAGHYEEWINACKGIEVPAGGFRGRFEYACPFTEMVLLGNVAVRCGKKIEYDADKMKITNIPEANKHLRREYREGWRDLI